jgi:hypothetical protein
MRGGQSFAIDPDNGAALIRCLARMARKIKFDIELVNFDQV